MERKQEKKDSDNQQKTGFLLNKIIKNLTFNADDVIP